MSGKLRCTPSNDGKSLVSSDEVIPGFEMTIAPPNVGSTLLDEYIYEKYMQVATFGPYAIWKKKA